MSELWGFQWEQYNNNTAQPVAWGDWLGGNFSLRLNATKHSSTVEFVLLSDCCFSDKWLSDKNQCGCGNLFRNGGVPSAQRNAGGLLTTPQWRESLSELMVERLNSILGMNTYEGLLVSSGLVNEVYEKIIEMAKPNFGWALPVGVKVEQWV